MRSKDLILAALLLGTGLACVETLHAGRFAPSCLRLAMATLGSLNAAPGTINFHATNPDAGLISGSSPGGLTWMVLGGSHLQNWTVSVQAGSSSFSGCPSIPLAAIRVNCSIVTVSGGAGTGTCGGPFPLSTTAQQVAGGTQGDGTNSYSVSINFTLAESWRYVGSSACPVSITYIVNAP